MLKQFFIFLISNVSQAAAFGRLCVETFDVGDFDTALRQPPSGGCVLKQYIVFKVKTYLEQPPSGGCVLKLLYRK